MKNQNTSVPLDPDYVNIFNRLAREAGVSLEEFCNRCLIDYGPQQMRDYKRFRSANCDTLALGGEWRIAIRKLNKQQLREWIAQVRSMVEELVEGLSNGIFENPTLQRIAKHMTPGERVMMAERLRDAIREAERLRPRSPKKVNIWKHFSRN